MDQVKYRNFFHAIAGNHKAINNTAENNQFFEVLRSFDPVNLVWDSDFVSALRDRMKLKTGNCVMVLEAIEFEWQDMIDDNRRLIGLGSFIILKKSNVNSSKAITTEVNQCLADTQAVCEQILAYVEEHNKRSWHSGQMLDAFFLNMNGCKFLPVGPLETNVFGTRVEFTFKTPKNIAIIYDDQWWDAPL